MLCYLRLLHGLHAASTSRGVVFKPREVRASGAAPKAPAGRAKSAAGGAAGGAAAAAAAAGAKGAVQAVCSREAAAELLPTLLPEEQAAGVLDAAAGSAAPLVVRQVGSKDSVA